VFTIGTQQQNPQPQQLFLIRQQAPVAPQPVAIRTIAVATPQPISVAVTPRPFIEARSNVEESSERTESAEPYSFGYNTHDEHGTTLTRQEESDGHGVVKGSYSYTSPDGLFRTVEYIADENGYRATVKTNEPGVANQDPADVKIIAEPPPANLIQQHASIPVQAPPPPPQQPVRVVLQPQPQPRPVQIVSAPQPQIRFVTVAAPQPQIRFVTASPQPQISFVTAAPPQQTLRFVTAAPQNQGFRIVPLPLANQQFAAPPQFRNFDVRRRA